MSAQIMTMDQFRQSSHLRDQGSETMSSPNAGFHRVLAFAALLLLAGCDAYTAPAPKSERPVKVPRVTFEEGNTAREFAGVVRARYEAELAAATSSLAQTSADYQRSAILQARGYASVADFDRKKAAKDEAEARLERARRSLDLARNQLGYADLKVDADGVITATLAEPGQVVAVGQAVARLAHHGEKEAVIALPETWLAEARRSKAIVRLWADRERSFDARLRELSPQADAATRTYAARFTIQQADDAVAFGMTATVTLAGAADAR